jgi:signal peptidase I
MVGVASPTHLRRRPPHLWVDQLLTFFGWLAGSYLVVLMLWVVVPMALLGWKPLVVVSHSMAPLIRAGDVVLVHPPEGLVGAGTVIAFHRGDEVMLHRVVTVDADGYVTRGDANTKPDSTVVPPESVIGRGRLLVPYLGLARVVGREWWVVLAILATAAIPAWRARIGLPVGVGLALLALVGFASTWANFADMTASAGSSLGTATVSPPTDLTASCGLIGAGSVNVELSWNPSPSPGLTGYRIFHDAPDGGTNFVPVGTVGPAQTTFTHTITGTLLLLGDHTYVVEALLGSWNSSPSNSDSVNITRVLLAYVCA